MRSLTILVLGVGLLGLASCSKQVGAPSPRTTPEHPAGDRTLEHTVRAGEDLARIADLYYGDPDRADRIAADNGLDRPVDLAAGSVLELHFSPQEYERAHRRAAALGPYNRGVAAMAAEDILEAQRQFRLALRTAPGLADARYNLALVLLERGQTDAAADSLAALVAERPSDPDFGFALGNARFHQTRYDEAAAAFARVLAAHPGHRRAAFGRARSLQEAGRRDEAQAAWQAYLDLDPDSSWAIEARRHLRELRGG
jgi:tetratricopeptide (TPR) repeat protein